MSNDYSMQLLSMATQMGWYKKPNWSYGGGRLPVLLEGAPGCGKTQAIKNVLGPVLQKRLVEVHSDPELRKWLAQDYVGEFAIGTLVVPQTSPETIEGIPVPDLKGMELNRLPLDTIKAAKRAVYGILFFDEITSGQEATGASIMTTVQDGVAGSTTLFDTMAIHLACNPADQAAAGRDLSLPEINRVMKLDWVLQPAAFLDFVHGGRGMANDVALLSPDWEDKNIVRSSAIIGAFLKTHPRYQNMVQSGMHKGDGPWASERAWVNSIRLLAACLSMGELPNSGIFFEGAQGILGNGAAEALTEFLKEMDLPDPELLIEEALKKDGDPLRLIPETVNRPDKRKIMLESVARSACRQHEQHRERWDCVWKILSPYLDKYPDEAQDAVDVMVGSEIPAGAELPSELSKVFKVRRACGIVPK